MLADSVILYDRRTASRVISRVTPGLVNFMSGTKSIVSILIGRLCDQGRISLSDKVTQYSPGHKCTILDIMTHKSGIDDRWNIRAHDRAPDVYAYVAKLPVLYEPGVHRAYNNNAVELLGLIIRTVTGKSVYEFARAEIFDGLGITAEWLADSNGNNYVASGLLIGAEDLLKIGLAMDKLLSPEYLARIRTDDLLFWNSPRGYRMDGYLGQILYIGDTHILVRQKKMETWCRQRRRGRRC